MIHPTTDQLNALNEMGAAFFACMNVRAIYRAKKVSGVYWPAWAFYSYWGIANLWVYPNNGMVWSFYGGIPVVIANLAWLALVFWYSRTYFHPQQAPAGVMTAQ